MSSTRQDPSNNDDDDGDVGDDDVDHITAARSGGSGVFIIMSRLPRGHASRR